MGFVIHSTSLCFLIDSFGLFTFKSIIDMLGLILPFCYLVFVSCISHSSVSLFSPSSRLLKHFLAFYLDLCIVFLNTSLCIV